jgi:hypothetical protein
VQIRGRCGTLAGQDEPAWHASHNGADAVAEATTPSTFPTGLHTRAAEGSSAPVWLGMEGIGVFRNGLNLGAIDKANLSQIWS